MKASFGNAGSEELGNDLRRGRANAGDGEEQTLGVCETRGGVGAGKGGGVSDDIKAPAINEVSAST